MRIGQMVQSVGVQAGGTSTAFLNTLRALRTRPEIALRAYAAPPPEGDPAWTDIRAHQGEWTNVAGYGRGLGPGAYGKSVIADIRAGAIDLLHIHGLWSPDLMACGLECRKLDVPYVWQPHGMLVREAYAQKKLKKDVYMMLGMRRSLSGAAGMVFVTADERDHSLVPAAIGEEKRHVVPLPTELPRMPVTAEFRRAARERFGLPVEGPVVVFMGRLHPVKRIDMAMRALAKLTGELAGTRLLLIGGGEEEGALRSLAASLGIAERVVFGGWVSGDDKWKALAAGDVLTLNSVHENFGYVAVEAMCVGTLPVLTSNLALTRDLPRSEGVCVRAAPTDEGLAEALARGLRSHDWTRTQEIGGAWVREHLSAEAVGARLLEVYRSSVPAGAGAKR
jgi:glycosyltransferase involved in cell wall biosynthesis